jgi:mannose/fructose/N-acetylgalactosamine-specific phosphotransferase system component IID
MKNNKKAISFSLSIILFFAISSVIFIFSSVLIKETGTEYFISPVADIGRDILNDTNISQELGVNAVTRIENKWIEFNLPYDLFFLLFWISTFALTVTSAFQSRKQGIFSFFGFTFVGALLFLLITSYIGTFTDWFMTEIFYKIFADINLSIPILTFYLSNLGLINFIWLLILILLNIIDRNFISKTGEVEE